LDSLGDGLWDAEDDLFLPGGIHFRVRMSVVALSDGVLLHSPIPIDDVLAEAIAAIGPVRHLVAPNLLHHLYLGDAQARYPDATTWMAPGLAAKRPDLRCDHVLTQDAPPWAGELEPLLIAGIPVMNEVVFRHAASRSVLVTDLFFHFHEVANWQSRLFFRLLGVLGRARQSPIVKLSTRDKAAASESVHTLLGWDFDRVVPAHGRVLEGGSETLRPVLGHMLQPRGLGGPTG
jgi:hypothetical protein